jgi:hypothetical protein
MICRIPASRSLRLTMARPSVFSASVRSESIVAFRYCRSVSMPTDGSLRSNSNTASPRGSTGYRETFCRLASSKTSRRSCCMSIVAEKFIRDSVIESAPAPVTPAMAGICAFGLRSCGGTM